MRELYRLMAEAYMKAHHELTQVMDMEVPSHTKLWEVHTATFQITKDIDRLYKTYEQYDKIFNQ